MLAIENTFRCSKQVLVQLCCSSTLPPKAAFALATDASRTHIGGTFQQPVKATVEFLFSQAKPCRFKILNIQQGHFRHILEGQGFQLWTDHNLLVTAFIGISKLICQLASLLANIAKFTSDLPGPEN